MAVSFSSDFRRFFGRGLGILLPTIVTLWILWQAFSFVYTNVAEPINRATRIAVIWVVPQVYSVGSRPEWFEITEEEVLQARSDGRYRPGTPDATIIKTMRRDQLRRVWNDYGILNLSGFIIAILLIYFAGLLLGNFFGRQIYLRVEALIARVPGFKQVYPHVKQVIELILGEKKMAFSKVVLVEYPSQGIWTIGFLTGDSLRDIDASAGGRVVSIFIPTSPTPFTGFTINVLAAKAIAVDVSIEEALRFVITAGVLTPESTGVAGGPRTLAAASAEEAVAKVENAASLASASPAVSQAATPAPGSTAASTPVPRPAPPPAPPAAPPRVVPPGPDAGGSARPGPESDPDKESA
jgi:uncharacterized membrane protein